MSEYLHIDEPSCIAIILNWNSWRDTIECVSSLVVVTGNNFSVVVVDNDSSDESYAHLSSYFGLNFSVLGFGGYFEGDFSSGLNDKSRSLCLIKSAYNGGYAYGNNYAINFVRKIYNFNYYWILNPDTFVRSNALKPMIDMASADTAIGIVGSVLVYADSMDIVQAVGGVKFNKYLARGDQIGNGMKFDFLNTVEKVVIDYVAGASMLVSDKFIDKVGLMSEEYFLYYEEIDWCSRGAKRGYSIGVAKESVVYHKEGGSIGTSSVAKRSMLSEYYLAKNLVIFYKKFMPYIAIIAVARNLRECVSHIHKKDFSRVNVILKATLHGLLGRAGRTR
jgi:GT2 family glycosyltransferase